ncbi:hypothetical protein [Veillonella sp. CHU110]|uniref:hypothetical protein n=1 Tax=Veillonella sp. CHU110 TaxID=2490947 RepID=UPI000F8D25EF|nr:hypothetical protein [Veillonella sp. CHU110]
MRFEVEKIRYRKEGLAAGRAEAIAEIVLGMLENNWSLELISKYTKLTVEQIIEIGRTHRLI